MDAELEATAAGCNACALHARDPPKIAVQSLALAYTSLGQVTYRLRRTGRRSDVISTH